MTKVFTRLSVLIITMLVSVASYGQVEISGTSYSRLSLAFNAINAGTHKDDVVVKITNNFTENTTAILYPSGYGNASYSSVVIYPTGTYKMDGNLSNGLIQLQGTKNVTIDGRVDMSGTTRALTIKNTSTSGPIIRIDSMISTSYASKYNVVRYCNIEHSTKSNGYGITLGASNSFTNFGLNSYNEIAYNSFKFMYQGVRIYGSSSITPYANKIYGNIFGSSNLAQSVSYQPLYIYYTKYTEIYDNVFEYLDHTSTIFAMYIWYAPNSKINNNIFRNVNHVSGLYGIYLYYAPDSEVKGNRFENFRTGASQCYPIYIYHNSQTPYNVSDNFMDNVGGTSTFYGIYIANGNYSTVNNNTMKNIVNPSSTFGIYLSSCPYSKVNNNTIDNMTSLINTTIYPYYFVSSNNSEFIGNKATNITCDGSIYGIYASSCATSKFNNNLFDNFRSQGTSTTAAAGLYILNSSSSEIVNNSISRMTTTQWSSSSTTANPFGILISSGTGYKIYYNSVNLTGKQIQVNSQPSLSACLMLTTTSVNNIDLRNNNFYNDLEGASGSSSYAIYLSGTGNLTNSTMDFNNYYVSGPHGILGFMGTNYTTLAAWKSATSRETNSNNIYTEFNSPSILAPYIGSALLGKGTPISGYQSDIIGVTRSSTNPTPGAYEQADDIVGPEILHTTLVTTTSTSNRTVVATITDKTGVNVSNSAPRIYYRKASSANTYNDNSSSTSGWKYSDATQNGNEFTLVVDYSKLQGGVSVGDFIEYFIIARDVSSKQNISATSGNFASFPTTTNLTSSNFPVNGATTYRIALGFSGNYSVGTSQTYTTLTRDNGIFRALNENVVSGDVTITIVSNISNETGEYQLKRLTYEGGPYNITIRPNSTTQRTISGDVAGALIGIVGANNITIDGSYNGAGRYLKILNAKDNGTSYTYSAAIMVGSGGGMGGNDLTIKNCEIANGSRQNYSFGIITSDNAISMNTSSNSMNNLLIKNNHIYASSYGIFAAGGTSIGTTTQNNLIIEDNIVGHDTKSSSILSYGIEVRYAPNGQIRRNKIYNFDGGPNNTNTMYGIQVYMTGSIPTYIDGNTITGLNYQGTSICFAVGINILTGSYAVIQNNFISDILTTAYLTTQQNSYQAYGIRVAGSYHKILHNTIIMEGEMKYYTNSLNYGGCAFNIHFPGTYSFNDVRGNILHNSVRRSNSSLYNPEAACIFVYASSITSTTFQNLDHNVYSVGNTAKYASRHNTTTVPYSFYGYSLGQWQSQTGRDQNSKIGMPVFVNTKTDLHINGTSIGDSYFMFNRLADVPNDGDGEMRNATTYYGADEVNPIFELAQDTRITPSQTTYCVDNPVTISAKPEVTGFGDGVERSGLQKIDMSWYKNGVLIPDEKNNNLTFNPVMMSDSANYYITGTFMGQTISSTETLLKVETPIAITMQPPNSDVCVTNPYLTMIMEATGTYTGLQWQFRQKGTSTWNDIPGKTTNVLELTITPALIGDYRTRITGPGNCGPAIVYTDAASVMFSDPLRSVNLHQIEQSTGKNLYYTCVDENITLNVTDEGTVFGYRWQINTGAGFIDLSASQYPTAHTPTLRINGSNPSESGIYRVKVLGSASCGTSEVFSQEVNVRIWPYFSLDEQPQSKTLCEGENSFIRVNISGIVYSYQWFKDGLMLTAAESEFYNKPVFYFTDAQFEDGGVYQCRVQAEDCFGFVDFMSDEASLYVVTGTEITVPPTTQAVVPGGTVNFRVRAHVNGTPENYKPEVQWYKGNKPMLEGGRFIGTKSDKLSIVNVQEVDLGEDYSVVVTGHCGSAVASTFGILKGEITIVEQPTDADVCEDETVILGVRAESSIPDGYFTYQWFRDGVALVDGNGLTGVKSNDLTISPAKPNHSGNYYCMVKEGKSVTGILTIEATVSIADKPVIVSQPEASLTIQTGGIIALMVEAEGTELAFQWYFKGNPIPDEDTNVLMIYDAKEENTGKYYIEISNNCGTVQSIETDVIVATSTTDVTDVISHGFSLGNATPNPVNGSSIMQYVTPVESQVRIAIVNDLGAEIAILVDSQVSEGTHNLSINAQELNLTSGVYSIVLKSSGVMLTQRLVVVR